MARIKKFNSIIICLLTIACIACQKAPYSNLYKDLPFEMDKVGIPDIPSYKVNIEDFGGKGDGIIDNTEAFEKAITHLNEKGGGHLIIPKGVWSSGPIELKSNIDLHLEDLAVIVFNPDLDKYPIIATSFEGLDTKRCKSPLSAFGAKNISITGKGVIDGSGEYWRPLKKNKVGSSMWKAQLAKGGFLNEKGDYWMPSETYVRGEELSDRNLNVPVGEFDDEFWESIKAFLRPVMVSLVECENVYLSGVTFQNSPAWNIHPLLCKNVLIDNIIVRNPSYSQNGDGIDIESCENFVLVNSSFDVGDDGICVKSGKDEDGRKRGVPTKNLIVDNCTVYHGHGGFVVGSEMSGGVENVKVSNCKFLGTDVGLRFKSKRGRGGVVKNIYIDNIFMKDIVTETLLFDLYYGGMSAVETLEKGIEVKDLEAKEVDETTPEFRDIYIEDIVCKGCGRAMYFNGLPEMPVKNINVKNCTITSKKGIEICESEDVTLTNVKVYPESGDPIKDYHVKNLNIINPEEKHEEYSLKMLNSEMQRCPNAAELDGMEGKLKWNYTTGLELLSFLDVYEKTKDNKILEYVYNWYDSIISEDGTIYSYSIDKHNVDHICPARTLFLLNKYKAQKKFDLAIELIYTQILEQPRTKDGGFWHKDIYPNQMWLDGLYMAQPFYALYAKAKEGIDDYDADSAYKDIAKHFELAYNYCYDPKTELLRHACDASKEMFWCDKTNGQSQHAWGRALGWYTMALVDVIGIITDEKGINDTENLPNVQKEIEILTKLLNVLPKYADNETGMWYQVLDSPEREGNYLEGTCSAMFAYTYLKASRLGIWKDQNYAKNVYKNFIEHFVIQESDGTISINDCCAVAGLGGKNNRSGTFDYYINEKIIKNDCKGVGPFIWASLEYERL